METRTVPLWTAALVVDEVQAAALVDAGRLIGDRIELDLLAARLIVGDAVVEAIAGYDVEVRRFFDAYAAGEGAGAYVITERILLAARQVDTKAARVDLGDLLEATSDVAGLAEVADAVTGPAPDWLVVVQDAFSAGLQITIDNNGNDHTVVVIVDALVSWPAKLGGPATRGELSRKVTLTVNHAKWRDRRNRRLVAVEVVAEEMWPDPAYWRARASHALVSATGN